MTITTADLSSSLAVTARALVAEVAPSLVTIGRHGRGSGFVVTPGFVATNAHNLRDRTTSVGFADGRVAQGTVSAADPVGDLVVLAVDSADAAALTWADAAVEQGDLVFAVVPGPHGPRVSFGLVSAIGRPFRGPRGARPPPPRRRHCGTDASVAWLAARRTRKGRTFSGSHHGAAGSRAHSRPLAPVLLIRLAPCT